MAGALSGDKARWGAQSAAEIAAGIVIDAGGGVLEVGTAGFATPIVVPIEVVGTAVIVHGAGLAGYVLMSKTNPKKEARENAKEKREQQPAPEKYAKDKAKDLEKREGKDARRDAHDKKEKGGGDRTKKQLDDDYE